MMNREYEIDLMIFFIKIIQTQIYTLIYNILKTCIHHNNWKYHNQVSIDLRKHNDLVSYLPLWNSRKSIRYDIA